MITRKIIIPLLLFFVCIACNKKNNGDSTPAPGPSPGSPGSGVDTIPSLTTIRTWLVDKHVTDETAALFYNLKKIARSTILFGHQDDTKRGVLNSTTQWANEEQSKTVSREKSDVKAVSGVFPAVYGHDFFAYSQFRRRHLVPV